MGRKTRNSKRKPGRRWAKNVPRGIIPKRIQRQLKNVDVTKS